MENLAAVDSIKDLLEQVKIEFERNNYIRVVELLKLLINIDSSMPEYFSAMGIAQKKLGNKTEAEKFFLFAVKIDPAFSEAYYNLALLFHEDGRFNDAVYYYLKAIDINPELYIAFYNLGNLYRQLEDYRQSIKYYQSAINIKKDYADAYYNTGVVFEKLYAFDEAIKYYDKTLLYEPEHVYAHWNKSILLLLNGDYKNGFEEYTWRLKRDEATKRNFTKPLLNSLDVKGKKILVYSEQGLGDTIQFIRYLPLLKKQNCRLIFETDPLLINLFNNLNFIDELIPRKSFVEPAANYDYQISLPDLPGLFNTTLSTIPSDFPYLFLDPIKKNSWEQRISKENTFNIGIVWAGNPSHKNDKNRSVQLSLFEKISSLVNVKLFSLQKGKAAGQINSINFPAADLANKGMEDFTDTAAVVNMMDLIITVDTSVAHLSGALNKITWLLLPYYSDWRWLANGSDSPWYPSMKLFRQSTPGDWVNVFNDVKVELEKLIMNAT